MIDLKGIEALDAEADSVDLYRVTLAGRHIGHLGLCLLHARQLHPSRIVLRAVSDCVLGEYRVGWRLPVHQNRVARHLLDAKVARCVRHCIQKSKNKVVTSFL